MGAFAVSMANHCPPCRSRAWPVSRPVSNIVEGLPVGDLRASAVRAVFAPIAQGVAWSCERDIGLDPEQGPHL